VCVFLSVFSSFSVQMSVSLSVCVSLSVFVSLCVVCSLSHSVCLCQPRSPHPLRPIDGHRSFLAAAVEGDQGCPEGDPHEAGPSRRPHQAGPANDPRKVGRATLDGAHGLPNVLHPVHLLGRSPSHCAQGVERSVHLECPWALDNRWCCACACCGRRRMYGRPLTTREDLGHAWCPVLT